MTSHYPIRQLLLSCLILFSYSTTALAADDIPAKVINGDRGKALEAYMAQRHADGFHGAVLVAQKGVVFLHNAYGVAQPASGAKWKTSTPATLGSVVKQFTAAAILRLEMEGKLSTADRISDHFESVPPDKSSMTIHHLLTHSSGLPPEQGFDFDAFTREQMVAGALAIELLWPPGTRYEYSNIGYAMLAAIVEKIAGKPYEVYLSETFFKPLGMKSTGLQVPEWDASAVSIAHDSPDNNSLLDLPEEHWNVKGNGGLYSTCADMYRWHLALQGTQVLDGDASKRYFTPWVPEDEAVDPTMAMGGSSSRRAAAAA